MSDEAPVVQLGSDPDVGPGADTGAIGVESDRVAERDGTSHDAVPAVATRAAAADATRRRAALLVLASLTVIVLGWIVILPPSAGSDEPGHVVRSAALVRGQLEDEGYLNVIFSGSYELPAWVGWPEPECWAFKLDVPVNCSTLLDEPSGSELRGTRAADYPVWGHLLPGIPTLLVDDPIGNRLARIGHAAVPMLLIAASIVVAARRGRVAAAGVLLAATPVALFNTATVNPSGLVIAGGIGLWTALVIGLRSSESGGEGAGGAGSGGAIASVDRSVSWLAAASWAAMVLPRRDGMIYGAIVLTIMLGLGLRTVGDLRRLLGRPQLVLAAAATIATFIWAVGSDTSGSRLLLVVPVLPVAVWAARTAIVRAAWARWQTAGVLTVGALVGAVLAVIFVQRRDATLDTQKWRDIVAETGADLFEAFGVLGWLDAPMPATFAFLFVGVLGALAGAAGLARPQALVAPGVVLVVGIVMSWWLTASQVQGRPEYWQGRYYLPLLVGVPILLAGSPELASLERARGLARVVGGAVALISVVALAAAMRRFAVGIDGTMAPWRWHTFGASISPLFPLLVVAVGWLALLWSVDRYAGLTEAGGRDADADADVAPEEVEP